MIAKQIKRRMNNGKYIWETDHKTVIIYITNQGKESRNRYFQQTIKHRRISEIKWETPIKVTGRNSIKY